MMECEWFVDVLVFWARLVVSKYALSAIFAYFLKNPGMNSIITKAQKWKNSTEVHRDDLWPPTEDKLVDCCFWNAYNLLSATNVHLYIAAKMQN